MLTHSFSSYFLYMNIDFQYLVNTDKIIPSRSEKQEQKSSLSTLDKPFPFPPVSDPNQSFEAVNSKYRLSMYLTLEIDNKYDFL